MREPDRFLPKEKISITLDGAVLKGARKRARELDRSLSEYIEKVLMGVVI